VFEANSNTRAPSSSVSEWCFAIFAGLWASGTVYLLNSPPATFSRFLVIVVLVGGSVASIAKIATRVRPGPTASPRLLGLAFVTSLFFSALMFVVVFVGGTLTFFFGADSSAQGFGAHLYLAISFAAVAFLYSFPVAIIAAFVGVCIYGLFSWAVGYIWRIAGRVS
jgi:hypothetical protein